MAKKVKFTNEVRKRMSEIKKKQWTNPEYRKKLVEAHKGKKYSEETKQKRSNFMKKWHKDVGFSEETKRNIGNKNKVSLKGKHCSPRTEFKKGEDHIFWRGGISPHWKTPEWKKISEKVKKRDNYLCVVCKKKAFAVHHLIPYRFSKSHDINNLISVCNSCHSRLDRKYDVGVEMPFGDVIDKITILVKKVKEAPELYDELERLLSASNVYVNGQTLLNICNLCKVNWQIWELENDIREGREGDMSIEEVGRRALEIRNINKKRNAIKNAINETFGQSIDFKVNHASDGEING